MHEIESTVLSYGMGVESTAILLRWCLDEGARPCSLDRILVITAQVGDEYKDTGRDVEAYILPMMRRHGIRFVQVARMATGKPMGSPSWTIRANRSRSSWKATTSCPMN